MENFAIDPDRPPYKPSVPVTVLADVLWLDEGHKRAFKGETIKVDVMDAKIAVEHGSAELVKQ